MLGQLFQMLIQMLAYLVFGGGDESQTDAIADQPGHRTHAEGQPVEQGV